MPPLRISHTWIGLPITLALVIACAALGRVIASAYQHETAPSLSVGDAGGGSPAVYAGPYEGDVRYLLDHAAGWRTSRDAAVDGGEPPQVAIANTCPRDAYVAAAAHYAWAAESYYRLDNAHASSMAREVHGNLEQANDLCAASTGVSIVRCRTTSIWGCPPPGIR